MWAEAGALTCLSQPLHYGRKFSCRQLVGSPMPAAQIVLSSKGWKKSSALRQAVFSNCLLSHRSSYYSLHPHRHITPGGGKLWSMAGCCGCSKRIQLHGQRWDHRGGHLPWIVDEAAPCCVPGIHLSQQRAGQIAPWTPSASHPWDAFLHVGGERCPHLTPVRR